MKTIFFDLDGTILDIYDRFYSVFNNYSIKRFLTEVNRKKYMILKSKGLSDIQIALEFNLNYDEKEYHQYKARSLEIKKYLKLDKLIFDFDKYAKILASKNYQIKLITLRRNFDNLNWQLNELKIINLFDEIIALIPNKINNPKRVFFENINVKDSILIGDSIKDYEATLDLDVDFINVETGLVNITNLYSNLNLINFKTAKHAIDYILIS
jgi:phosphoglycolate phosphatase